MLGRLWEFYLAQPELALLLAFNALFAVGAAALAVGALLLRGRNDRKAARWNRLEERWLETALAVVAGAEERERVWALVPAEDRVRFLNFLLRFARRLGGPERRVVDELAAPYLDLLLPQLSLRQPERRARAVQTLSALGQRRYAKQLEAALDDPSPLVAMVAARALARRENPDFALPILRRMDRFGQWRASFLASMLAAIGPAVATTLRRALGDAQFDARVRAVAADALRELNDYASADVAATVLKTAVDRDLVVASLGLLAHMGRNEHLPAIRRHLTAAEPIVRARAISALGNVGSPEDIPTLTAALADPSPWVALRAAEALRDARALAALHQLEAKDHPRRELLRQLLAGQEA
jgi:HEAT repeat protein